MRIKAALIIAALAATAMPAAAQTYSQNCAKAKTNNQIGGAIVGGILGGVLGSNTAARGHKHDGTALGAVLGGAVGAGIGGSSTNCTPRTAPGYGYPQGRDYDGQYGGSGYGYPQDGYPADPGYSSGGYSDRYPDERDEPYYDGRYSDHSPRRLYPDDNRSYNRNDNHAGRDCTEATQITRLPDGTVIRRPVEACRDAYYGDWRVRD